MYGQKHAENDFTVLFRFPEHLSDYFLPLVVTMPVNIVVIVAVTVPVCPKIGARAKNLSFIRRMKIESCIYYPDGYSPVNNAFVNKTVQTHTHGSIVCSTSPNPFLLSWARVYDSYSFDHLGGVMMRRPCKVRPLCTGPASRVRRDWFKHIG